MNEINLLSDQDKEQALNQGGPDEKTGTDAASDNEGEVVDEPDADLMLLLVDHKTNERIHLKFKSPHEKEDWIELIQKGKEDMSRAFSLVSCGSSPLIYLPPTNSIYSQARPRRPQRSQRRGDR